MTSRGRAPATEAATPAARSPATRIDQAERSLLCPVLIDRERELDVLTRAADVMWSKGGMAVLVGEAGMGKTRLTREVGAIAGGRGVTVLRGRAVPSAAPVPYRPLTEAVVTGFRAAPPAGAPELAGFAGQLGRLVPEWAAGQVGGADESPVLLGEAVVRLLRTASRESGCILVLEDLHWADTETLAVVEYLADALQGEAALCLCTARPEGAFVDLLARLRRSTSVTVLSLAALGPQGIERAVGACLRTAAPPVDVVDVIASRSEGNPFLIEELLAGLVATDALHLEDGVWSTTGRLAPAVPFDFAESMRHRLAALDPTGRRVLRAAALLGRQFDWDLLPALAGVDGRSVVDALRTAVEEQLVEADGDVFRFRHALTREAVLAELLPPERRSLARAALPAVEGAHPGLPGPWCELAAELAEQAGDLHAACAHLVESAHRALAKGALASAERTARRARSLAPAGGAADAADEVLVEILALAGQPDEAGRIGDALVERLRGASAPAARVTAVLVVLARAAVAAGDLTRAHKSVTQGRELLSQLDDALAARVEAIAAHVALEQDRLHDARAHARAAIELARRTGQPAVECEALEVLGRMSRFGPDGALDGDSFERAAALAARHGLVAWEVRARHEMALMAAYTNGDVGPLHEAREVAARNGALVSVAVMDLALAEVGLGTFEADLCLESASRCVEASRRYGLATLPVACLWLAGGCALVGDDAGLEAACDDALRPDPEDPRILGDLWGRVRATRSMVRDDRRQLRSDLDRMMTYVRVAPVSTSMFPNRVVWGLLHTIDDDDNGAVAIAELRAARHMIAWPPYASILDMLDAVALGRAGRAEEATARYAAARVHERPDVRGGSARYFDLLVAGAAIRDGWGEPVAWLRQSEAFFAQRGFDRIVRSCRAALASAGAPLSRRGRGDSVVPESLRALGVTSRELDVLTLVAEGLSNREVAERLFLSQKTVERHLSSLFDRTGRRSRTALAELLHSLSG